MSILNQTTLVVFTIKEIAKLFDREWLTVLRWRKAKGMPHLSIPGSGKNAIRFDLEQIEAWSKKAGIPMNRTVLKRYRKRLDKAKKE